MKGDGGVHVFMLNDYEWWAARTMEEAVQFAMEECGTSREETLDESSAHELSDEEMKRMQFIDDSGAEKVKRSFAEQLALMVKGDASFPCMFATTEF